jgi:D-alanine-D-alanine ligase
MLCLFCFQNKQTVKEKIKVAIVFGGRSTEHAISLLSAQNVLGSLDKDIYEPVLIGIDKKGQWHYNEKSMSLLNAQDANSISMTEMDNPVLLSQNTNQRTLTSVNTKETISRIDVIFPVLHGTYGEDGSIQGLAKLANIPVVGCGILGSAIGMDKDIMKRILRDDNIGVAKWVTIKHTSEGVIYQDIVDTLGTELFIKPANLGSSVGISLSNDEESFFKGLEVALQFDSKVIIEEKIIGREIECAVLGNEFPKASIPGEIIPKDGFYSFESKYLDESGAKLQIPADLTENQIQRVQSLALETFKILECSGMSRIDMFLKEDDSLIINEINTIPGFTNISMYPKLWEYSGLPQKELISKLIDLAIEAHNKQNKLKLT